MTDEEFAVHKADFDKFDKDGSGKLDGDELEQLVMRSWVASQIEPFWTRSSSPLTSTVTERSTLTVPKCRPG